MVAAEGFAHYFKVCKRKSECSLCSQKGHTAALCSTVIKQRGKDPSLSQTTQPRLQHISPLLSKKILHLLSLFLYSPKIKLQTNQLPLQLVTEHWTSAGLSTTFCSQFPSNCREFHFVCPSWTTSGSDALAKYENDSNSDGFSTAIFQRGPSSSTIPFNGEAVSISSSPNLPHPILSELSSDVLVCFNKKEPPAPSAANKGKEEMTSKFV